MTVERKRLQVCIMSPRNKRVKAALLFKRLSHKRNVFQTCLIFILSCNTKGFVNAFIPTQMKVNGDHGLLSY